MLSKIYRNLEKGSDVRISLTGRKEVINGIIAETYDTHLVLIEERHEGLTQRKYINGEYIEEIVVFEG